MAAAFPATDVENRTLGGARDALTDAASKVGENVMQAASKAGERLKSAAQERGLTPDGLKELAGEVADTFTRGRVRQVQRARPPHREGQSFSGLQRHSGGTGASPAAPWGGIRANPASLVWRPPIPARPGGATDERVQPPIARAGRRTGQGSACSRSGSAAFARTISEFKDTLWAEARETKDELIEKTKDAAQDGIQRIIADLKERAAANPAAVLAIGAGLALVHRPRLPRCWWASALSGLFRPQTGGEVVAGASSCFIPRRIPCRSGAKTCDRLQATG